jgi:hypothetical protein
MDKILLLLATAEAVSESIKWLIDGIKQKSWDYDRLIAFVVSITVCVLAGFDLFSYIGWDLSLPYAGSFLTGIAVSRGANILHDVIKLPSMIGKGST